MWRVALICLVACSKESTASPAPSASVSAAPVATVNDACKNTDDCSVMPFVAVCVEGHCKKVFDECRKSEDCLSMPFSAECIEGHCKKRRVDESPVGGTCKADTDCAAIALDSNCCNTGCEFRYGSKTAVAALEKRCAKQREVDGVKCGEGLGLACLGTRSSRCKEGQCVKW